MAQTATGKSVRISSECFKKGYAQAIEKVTAGKLPSTPSESAVILMVKHILSIVADDGDISDEQLQWECGRIVGYLVSTIG